MGETKRTAAINAIYAAASTPARVVNWALDLGYQIVLEEIDKRAENSNRNLLYQLGTHASVPSVDQVAHPAIATKFGTKLAAYGAAVDSLAKRLDADPDGYSAANVNATDKLIQDSGPLTAEVQAALLAEQQRLAGEKQRLTQVAANLLTKLPVLACVTDKTALEAAVGKVADAFTETGLTTPMVENAEKKLADATTALKTIGENVADRVEKKDKIVAAANGLSAKLAVGKVTSDGTTVDAAAALVAKAFEGKELSDPVLKSANEELDKATDTLELLNKGIAARLARKQKIETDLGEIRVPEGSNTADRKLLEDATKKVTAILQAAELTGPVLDQAQVALAAIAGEGGTLAVIKGNIFGRAADEAKILNYPPTASLTGAEPTTVQAIKDRVAQALTGDKLTEEGRKEMRDAVGAAKLTINTLMQAIEKRRKEAEQRATDLWNDERNRLFGQIANSLKGGSPAVANKEDWMKEVDAFLKADRAALQKQGWTEANVQADIIAKKAQRDAAWPKVQWELAEKNLRGQKIDLVELCRQSLWVYFGYKGLKAKDWTPLPKRPQNRDAATPEKALHLSVSGDSMADPMVVMKNAALLQGPTPAIFDALFMLSNTNLRVHATREAWDNPKLATREHVYLGGTASSLGAPTDAADVLAMTALTQAFRTEVETRIDAAKLNGWKGI